MSAPTSTSLRQRAEQLLQVSPPAGQVPSVQDLQTTVEELRVYEAELQIQNEDLIASRAQVEESRKKYFRHFDLAPVGLFRLSHEGLILEANILAAEMLGVNRALLHKGNRPFLAHLAPESLGTFRQHLESALASHTMEACEVVLRSTTAPALFVRMQSVVSRGERETMDFYTTLTDLTERRHIEQELERQKNLADAAITSKELFLAMVSHELRTPLTPLFALVRDFATDTRRPADDLAVFAIMRRNLDLEIHLIDDLLDLTRVSSGKLDLQIETTDLHLCIAGAIDICRHEVSTKGLELVTDLDGGAHFVNADPGRLQQVFWNLIKNGVKFTTAPGTLTIRTRSYARSQVTVEFQDSGIGIEQGPLNHIFDPFFQVDPTIKRRAGGLGLGLAICKSITDAHGGTLTATSAGKGKGTTFRLTLHTVPAPAAALVKPVPFAPLPAGCNRRSGLRLLLVEDHEDTRLVLALLLTRRGYHVEATGNSEDALALCAKGKFDILVTDIGLQGETGYDVLEALNARYGLRGIAMSGFDSDIDLARGKEAGFLEYLVKPIDAESLDAAVQRVAAVLASQAG